jgi:hypothetical protein
MTSSDCFRSYMNSTEAVARSKIVSSGTSSVVTSDRGVSELWRKQAYPAPSKKGAIQSTIARSSINSS